jgi:serine/threonine protein kinase
VAPEVLKNAYFSTKADIFSVGSFFFNLVTGKNLFQGRNGKELLVGNMFSNPFSTVAMHVTGVSSECKALMQQMVAITAE